MKGMQKFFSFLVAMIFCFCLVGCWDGDGGGGNGNSSAKPSPQVSYEASEEGSAVEFNVPLRSSRMRFSGDVPVFTSAWVEVGQGNDSPTVKPLEIVDDGDEIKAHGKFKLTPGAYTAKVFAENEDRSVRFSSDLMEFEVRFGEITKISVNMRRVETETENGVVELENITWTWTVPWDFSTIQAAIDISGSGDTVIVDGGTYVEYIEMKSGVRLIGQNGATLKYFYAEPYRGYIIWGAPNATVKGFIFKSDDVKDQWHSGVRVFAGMEICDNIFLGVPGSNVNVYMDHKSGKDIMIHHNIISDGGDGIYVEAGNNEADNVQILHNTFINRYSSVCLQNYSPYRWKCALSSNIFVGCARVIYTFDRTLNLQIDMRQNIYSKLNTVNCSNCLPFEFSTCDEKGDYYSRPIVVDPSNSEIDPMLDADYAPTNPAVCGIGEGGVTPGARECAEFEFEKREIVIDSPVDGDVINGFPLIIRGITIGIQKVALQVKNITRGTTPYENFVDIPKDGGFYFSVETFEGVNTGDELKIIITDWRYFQEIPTPENVEIVSVDVVVGPVYKSFPIISQIPLTNEELRIVNGVPQAIYKWKVEASSCGNIGIKQMPKIKVAWQDLDTQSELRLSSLRLFRGTTDITDFVEITNLDGVSVKMSALMEADKAIFIYFLPEEIIAEGATLFYSLKATPENFDSAPSGSDKVALIMLADNASAGNKRYVYCDNGIWKLAEDNAGTGAEQFNFLWSDRSALPHSAISGTSTADWFNGYLIKNLPLSHVIMEK